MKSIRLNLSTSFLKDVAAGMVANPDWSPVLLAEDDIFVRLMSVNQMNGSSVHCTWTTPYLDHVE